MLKSPNSGHFTEYYKIQNTKLQNSTYYFGDGKIISHILLYTIHTVNVTKYKEKYYLKSQFRNKQCSLLITCTCEKSK